MMPTARNSRLLQILCICILITGLVANEASSNHGNDNNIVTNEHQDEDNHHSNSTGGHGDNDTSLHSNDTEHGSHGVHLASINIEHVRTPLAVTIFMIVVALCKLGFHHANFLSSRVPESCLLIILGTFVGIIVYVTGADRAYFHYFTSDLFFLYLLPPIILESAYSLHDRVFFDNLGTILMFAVVGTILNCFVLGPVLYGLAVGGAMGPISITLIQCLVFSALIVAVDPVAVLAIFQEVGVNNVLYFIVFGESLLNDAVTVVIYNTMKAFSQMDSIPPSQIGLGIGAFFTVSLGGLAIGILLGALSSFITKFTKHVRVVEPLAIFSLAYASYLMAELFHFSGIISIIGCGLMQAQYAFHNISHKSLTTVTYFGKMLSATCDSIIFLFLGLALVNEHHEWHTGFVLWSVFLCLGIRFIFVYLLTFLANRYERLRKLDWEEQFIMAYGGLRGAVAFSLVAMLDSRVIPNKAMFETTTLAIIIFTVFVQGITIKPLVKLLRISSSEKNPVSIYEEINCHVTDHVMAGIEEILGHYGHNFIRERFDYFDNQYLRCWFMRDPSTKDDDIMEIYQRMAIQLHFENVSGTPYGLLEDFTSDWELYKPEHLQAEEEDIPAHPDLAHRTLDQMKRKSLGGPRQSLRYSIGPGLPMLPPSWVGPRSPRSPRSPRDPRASIWSGGVKSDELATSPSQSPRLDRIKSTPEPSPKSVGAAEVDKFPRRSTVLSDDVFMEKHPSKDTSPAPGQDKDLKNRRRSLFQRLRGISSQASSEGGVIENPKTEDIRKMLVKNPSRQAFHRKYDRNLTQEDNSDLLHHLHEKRLRNDRRRYSMALLSPTMTSPMGSPYGSTEDIARRATLDVIEEGVPMSSPERERPPRNLHPRRGRGHPSRGRLQKAATIEPQGSEDRTQPFLRAQTIDHSQDKEPPPYPADTTPLLHHGEQYTPEKPPEPSPLLHHGEQYTPEKPPEPSPSPLPTPKFRLLSDSDDGDDTKSPHDPNKDITPEVVATVTTKPHNVPAVIIKSPSSSSMKARGHLERQKTMDGLEEVDDTRF